MGIYNYALAYIAMFSGILGMGLENIVIKDLAQKGKNEGEVLFAAFILLVVGALISGIGVVLGTSILGIGGKRKVLILLLSIQFIFNPCNIFRFWLYSRSQIQIVTLYQCCLQVFFLILKVIVLCGTQNLTWFMAMVLIEACMVNVIYFIIFKRRKHTFPKFKYNRDILRWLLKVCFPIVISSISVTLYCKMDQLMIGNMLGDSELGVYSVAVKMAEFWYIVPAMLYTAILPKMSEMYVKDKRTFQNMSQHFADVLAVIGYAAIFLIFILAQKIIPWMYGEEYVGAVRLTMIYVIGGIAVSIGYHFSVYAAIKEWSIYSLILTTSGVMLNFFLNIILINRYGSTGAVCATVIVYIYSTFGLNSIVALFNKEIRIIMNMEWKSLFPIVRLLRHLVKKGKMYKNEEE